MPASKNKRLGWLVACVLVLTSLVGSTALADTGNPVAASSAVPFTTTPSSQSIKCEVVHKSVDVYTCSTGTLPSAAEQDRLADKLIASASRTTTIADGSTIVYATCGVVTNVSPPTITGNPQPGYSLHAEPGSWQSTCYQIINFGFGWNDGTPGPDHGLSEGDVGHTLWVTVTATDTEGNSNSAPSGTVTIQPSPAPPPPPPPAPSIDSLSASPNSVVSGGTVGVTWSASNATGNPACVQTNGGSSGWGGNTAASGSWTSAPLYAPVDLSLTCYNSTGQYTTRTIHIDVSSAPPVPTATLSASPNPVPYGQNVLLSWSTTNSTGCKATWTTSTAANGSQSVGPMTADTTFVTDCGGAGGNTSASVLVTVTGAPPDTTPPTTPGTPVKSAADLTSTTIQWGSSSDNTRVMGYGLYVNGSLVNSTTATYYTFSGLACGTTYTLAVDAYDAAGNRSAKASISVSTTACPVPTCSGTVVLYDGPNYTGNCWSYAAGNYPGLGTADNMASSIKVADGYVATLFADSNYAGARVNVTTTADTSSWTGIGDNAVSSLVIQAAAVNNSYAAGVGSQDAPIPSVYQYYRIPHKGCAQLGNAVKYNNTFGTRLWLFGLKFYWCWDGKRITSIYAYDRVLDVISPPFPLNFAQGWDYNESGFNSGQAGNWTTIVQLWGKFQYCAFKIGCTSPVYPWVKFQLYSDGTATCTTSFSSSSFPCPRANA